MFVSEPQCTNPDFFNLTDLEAPPVFQPGIRGPPSVRQYVPLCTMALNAHRFCVMFQPRTVCACTFLLSGVLAAQDADRLTTAPSRAEEIETQRQEKSRDLTPEEPLKGERVINRILNNPVVKAFMGETSGFGILFGGLVTGSGIAAGPQYVRSDLLDDNMTFRALASGSIHKFWLAKTEVELPRLANNWLFADFSAQHRDYPYINYFGQGPNTAKADRTTFELQDTWVTGMAGVHPLPHTKVGVIGRYLVEGIGPGNDSSYPTTEENFTPETTPGLLGGSDFVQAGSFLQFDYRDNSGEAHKGGMYWLDYSDYTDTKLGRYSFSRVDAQAQQYIPFFNDTHVLALHARTTITEAHSGDIVPFFLQPTLGGPDTLRGFEAFRFYDNNAVVLNAEYRWQLNEGVDAAVFMDAGQVFPKWQQISLRYLEKSYGFGLRFLNSGGQAFVRFDVGFSREGFDVWFKFGNVFGSGFRNFDNFY
jgi:Haemolysin secretion/activation protein ShlB/FhaC/HecB